ncbi:RsfA family transcriptional regulator [Peribacillus deserti]|uniref:RsfA family transcriptional regulator n=1 Tax=Peribacillus deserti TaxID=673318 RepID=A0A2N5LZZ0_9BACI|nr:RsfA family transcriptional regulator [Peribacillus deserti]PLT27686.1 RsfA family transcriptional regulator [Peribacillus deserti]
MSIARQDAWSQDEDLLLAEVVLRHIREGSTQLKAFEEVGKKLSRTSAACGFRWNSFVRKQYKSGIELAKKQRKQSKKNHFEAPGQEPVNEIPLKSQEKNLPVQESISEPLINLNDVIQFLVEYDQSFHRKTKEQENEELKQELEQLKKEHERALEFNRQLQEKLKTVEDDYRALIQIMERARKLMFLEEEIKGQNVKFQMDKNGNLERVKK